MAQQQPDTQPGPYYVSAIDGSKWALVSGPYETHQEALDLVDKARRIAVSLDPRAHFAGFGTARIKDGSTPPGVLQRWGYSLQLEKEGRHEDL
jgi:hypothetical protein